MPEKHEFIYFPLKSTQLRKSVISCNSTRYKYKLLHTSLDSLIRNLQLNLKTFEYYTKIPIEHIPVAKNRYNLENEISAVLPFSIIIGKIYKLDYHAFKPQKRRYGISDVLDTTYSQYAIKRNFS